MCYAILGDEAEFRRWGLRIVQLSRVEDPPLAAKFEEWLEDPPKKIKKWAWRKKQQMQRPGRKKMKSGQDLESPIIEDTFQLLFQIMD